MPFRIDGRDLDIERIYLDFPHSCVHPMEQALNAELKGSSIERMLGMESELFPRGIYSNILYTQLEMWKDSEAFGTRSRKFEETKAKRKDG